MSAPTPAERHCLYADVADGTHCALRATADSPPPTSVQWRVLLAERDALREQVERQAAAHDALYAYHQSVVTPMAASVQRTRFDAYRDARAALTEEPQP